MRRFSRGALRYGAAGMILALAVAAGTVHRAQAAPARVTRVTVAETVREIEVLIVASRAVRDRLVNVRPDWIVVDVLGADLGIPPGRLPLSVHGVKQVRVGQFERGVVRVVVELERPMAFRIIAADGGNTLLVRIPTEAVSRVEPRPVRTTPASPNPVPGTAAGETGSTPRPQAGAPRVFSVVPGAGIGAVRIGMRLHDVVAVLGPWLSTAVLPDGSTIYRWFAPPANRGIGVRVSSAGVVSRVWVVNDDRYVVEGRIRAGSTEAQVRGALGEPRGVIVEPGLGMKVLTYSSLGIWIGVQLDTRYTYYNAVFEIGVMESNVASHSGD